MTGKYSKKTETETLPADTIAEAEKAFKKLFGPIPNTLPPDTQVSVLEEGLCLGGSASYNPDGLPNEGYLDELAGDVHRALHLTLSEDDSLSGDYPL